MRKSTVFLFCFFFFLSLAAQNYTKTYSSMYVATDSYYDSSKSACYATSDNGSIQTNYYGGNLNVDKLNSTGCVEWSFNFNFGVGSKGSIVKQLSDGNFLVCGTVGYETLAMKLDGFGTIIWSKKYDLFYGEPIDFAQKGNDVVILAGLGGPGGGGHDANDTLLQIDQTNGNLISAKTIDRIALETADVDLLCRYTRIISTAGGYALGGFAYLNKYFSDPLMPPNYSDTPILTYLDPAGSALYGRYFTEGSTVRELIEDSSGQFLVAIENHDYRYIATIPASYNRLTLFKVSSFGILWQKTYVPPLTAVSYVANQLPNNMEFTNTGDILITGFTDQGAVSGNGLGNYVFKIDSNGNLLSDLLILNNSFNQGVTGLKITPTNDFIMGMYLAGTKRFASGLSTSLCGYNPIPLVEYDDTVTSLNFMGVTETSATVNAIAVTPVKTITNAVVTTLCGTICPPNLPCYDSTTTGLYIGLLAYYPFGGGSLNDFSGNGHHLSNTTTAHATVDRNGNANCAFNFTKANNEKLQLASPAFLDNLTTAPFSISLWYQPLGARPIGDFEQLIGRDNGLHCPDTFGQWSLSLYDCRRFVVGFDRNSHWQSLTAPDCGTFLTNTSNHWHHAAFVYDGTTYKLYVDGVLDSNTHGPCGSMSANLGNFLLGKDYTGDLDDILIYNRALTAAEVTQLQGLGSSCCSDGALSVNSIVDDHSGIILFPNPAFDFIRLQDQENASANFEYKISDASGRIIKSGRSGFGEKINIEALSSGNYVIQVATENGEKTNIKLIKN